MDGASILGFARRAGVAESVMRKYLEGAMPSTDRLVSLADAGGVNIAWLAAGRGPKKGPDVVQASPIDLDRLERTLEAVELGLRGTKRPLPPAKHAELVTAAYQLMESAHQAPTVVQFIKAAVR